MDTIPTKEDLIVAFRTAPQYIKDFIRSDAMGDAFNAIRDAHTLHLDDAGRLSVAINTIVLGLAPLTEFEKLARQALTGVAPDVQAKVIGEVNDKIFTPMRAAAAPKPATAPVPPPAAVTLPATKPVVPVATSMPPAIVPATPAVTLLAPEPTSVIAEKLEMRTREAPKEIVVPPASAPHPYSAGDPYREPMN